MTQSILDSRPKTTSSSATMPRLDMGLRPILFIVLIAGLIALFLLIIAVGSVNIPIDQIIKVLLGGQADKEAWTNIILKFRLPKALTAMLAGSALGISGLMMQTFFRNPLAGPFVLGISSGASLGVAVVVLSAGTLSTSMIVGFSLGMAGDVALAVAAGIGAGITMMVVLLVSRRVESSTTLLILGLMVGYITSALVSLLLHFAIAERIQAYINWTFGSFGGVTWNQLPILAVAVLIGLIIAIMLTKSLNALLLGETYAISMGLNIQRARIGILLSTALLAGAVTAFCGPIGFVGVAVPHLCRTLFNTSDHRVLVPSTILMGAIVALVAGLIAEVPGQSVVLPLNAVTSLIGAPVVIIVILRQRNLQKSFTG